MEIKISLNEYADVAFIKKLLSQIKDIKSIEFFNEIEEPKEYSWDEIESSEEFHALIKKKSKDFEEGRFVEHSPELIESIFRKKMKILYSEIALETLDVIIDFLELNWSEKQILFLKNDILKFEQTISDRLISHQSLAEFPAVRFTLIAKKQVKIYYMKIDDNIKILAFLPSKSNPATIKNILR